MKFQFALSLFLGCFSVILLSQEIDLREMPDGTSVQIAEDGSYKILAVGTGTFDFNDPDDINDARREALLHAKTSISKFLKEEIASNEAMDNMSKKAKNISSAGKIQTTNVSKESLKTTMESIKNSSSALLTGVVTLQEVKVPGAGEAGSIKVLVGVSSVTMKAAGAVTKGVAENAPKTATVPSPVPPRNNDDNVSQQQSNSNQQLADGWIECIGIGKDRNLAVKQALVEGIAQVYGTQLQNDERFSQRMQKLKKQDVAGASVSKSKQSEMESNTLTRTAGFVKEYRIVNVIQKNGMQEATVHAYIVNPRAGGTAALRVHAPVMPISMHTQMFKVGEKKILSGAQLGIEINSALPIGLAKANRFLIITDSSNASMQHNSQLTKNMVANGQADASELMQLGQGLTPDFSLQTEVVNVAYSKKLGMNRMTKKLEPQYKFSVKLKITLFNDRLGQQIKSTSIDLNLNNQEITQLLSSDEEEADLLQAVLAKLADPLSTMVQ